MTKINRYNIIFIVIMTLFFLWGLISFKDYGISWDEEIQRIRGLGGLRTAITAVMGDEAVPERLKEKDVAAISTGALGLKLPVLTAEYMTGFSMTNEKVFKLYHLYNFLVFFLSAICAYLLFKELEFGEVYSLLGLVLYIVCPRILADSFYNNKDLAMLSLLTMALFLSVSAVRAFNRKKGVLLAIVTALAITVRLVAALPVVMFAAYYIITGIMSRDGSVIKKRSIQLALTAALSFIVLFLLTPRMWGDIGGTIAKRVSSTFNFTHGGFEMVAGIMMNRTELPWYYLPLSFVLTMPCLYIIFLLIGGAAFFIKQDKGAHMLWLLFWQLIFFAGYPMVAKPMQYNLWRHFYFLFIYIVIFTVYGIRFMAQRPGAARVAAIGMTAVSLLLTVKWIFVNHPYEYLYFNPLFRGEAAKNTDQDYWAVTYKGLLSQISDPLPADVYIYPTLTGNLLFGQSGWENFHSESLEHSAKYRIVEGNPGDDSFYRILKTVEVDGRISESLIRRENYGNVLRRYYVEDGVFTGENFGDEADGYIYTEGTDTCVLLTLPDDAGVYEVDLLRDGEGEVASERVYISDTMSEYRALKDGQLMREDDVLGVSLGDKPLPKYLLYKFENCREKGCPSIAIRLFGREEGSETDELSCNRYDAAKYIKEIRLTEEWEEDHSLMTDGDEESACHMTTKMKGNEAVELCIADDFGTLKGLRLDTGSEPMCGGRKIVIEGSDDGDTYEALSWHYSSADDYVLDEPTAHKFIRVSQKARGAYPWAVAEIGLLK